MLSTHTNYNSYVVTLQHTAYALIIRQLALFICIKSFSQGGALALQ